MDTLLIAIASFAGFIIAYNTYGRWLGRKVFGLDDLTSVPSETHRDGIDYVPTRRSVVFGHHFTSIAGTGPIVGPAIAVFWGWLPALIWVLFGSIFIGAVHDFGSLVVSLRNDGRSVADVAGRTVSPAARILLLIVLVFELAIVLAVFGLVIALIFSFYPESVLSVWLQIPLALGIGYMVHRRSGSLILPSLVALAIMYLMVYIGGHVPIRLTDIPGVELLDAGYHNAVVIWTLILLAYCFVASVLPVGVLLQPRDYINSQQLMIVMVLLVAGMAVASFKGQANLLESAPAIAAAEDIPSDAPAMIPFLFITVACGAVSGFHCLVSSGTSSKQLACAKDALSVGYGSMLLEGALAVIVILACCSGLGMGLFDKQVAPDGSYQLVAQVDNNGQPINGLAAWRTRYNPDTASGHGWNGHNLGRKLGAFIDGGANFLSALGIPLKFAVGLLAVFVASFAATTLDTATRLQRYVLEELGQCAGISMLRNRYVATFVALLSGGAVAIFSGKNPGSGGMSLWPIFGATNQLLAGLALIVISFHLAQMGKRAWFIVLPCVAMLVIPGWAMTSQMGAWLSSGKYMLFGFAIVIQLLAVALALTGITSWLRLRRQAATAKPE